jgi:hypothetical protein
MPDPTPHVPTEKTRAEVSALYSFGNTQEEIAAYLGICVDTLAKYYRKEMDVAVVTANARVARALYNKAVAQDDLTAQIFWLKTRARWRTADAEDTNNKALSIVEKMLDAK